MENDTRCTCNPMDSEIYCPVHTTSENYLHTVESMYERVERQSVENIVKRFKKIRKEKDMKKYYTPSISDIRVGYECEVWVEYWNDEYKGNEWKSWTVSHQDIQYGDSKGVTVIGLLYPHFSEPRIRTPYLTKEQIEAEGWEVKETHWSGSNFSFEKGNYGGVQLRDGRVAIIMLDVTLDDYTCNTSNGQLYLGKCPSINEFRFINKLLGI
jgi:glutaredoxin-related protein